MGDKSQKGASKKKYYQAAKNLQGSHRERRLNKVLRGLATRLARAQAAGRKTQGLEREIEQLRYALSYQRPQGKKGNPSKDSKPFTPEPPHHRPPGFWNRHERVWGQLARKMRVENGEILPSNKVDQFLQAEAEAKAQKALEDGRVNIEVA